MKRARFAPVALLILAAAMGLSVPVSAQRVRLRIHPPLGDTLRMELQQRFEMEARDTSSPAPRRMTGTMRVWTRTVVLGRTGSATDLLSVTDSVVVLPPSAALLPTLRDVKRALEGRTVRLRIAENGEILVGDGGGAGAMAASGLVADMPAVLPSTPTAVGDAWTRDIHVPFSAAETERALVHTTFRLDSLGRDGSMAFLSLRGNISHDHGEHSSEMHGKVTGTLAGTIEIDRRIWWITKSNLTLMLTSIMAAHGGKPVIVRMRITQSLRALVGD